MIQTKRARVKAVKKDEHASKLLKVLRATGLFRWEKPSTHAEEIVNILCGTKARRSPESAILPRRSRSI